MFIRIRELLRARHDDEVGALSAEYVGVLIVIGLLVAALIALQIPDEIETRGGDAVDDIFGGEGDGDG